LIQALKFHNQVESGLRNQQRRSGAGRRFLLRRSLQCCQHFRVLAASDDDR
jgi:hypothetical protein